MGTKIEHAIDPLATSTNSSNSFTLQYRVDDWNYLQSRKLKKFQKTDNNFMDSMDRESIKKTMLIHEEIFKHQVKELHRLYGVQKRLMGELRKESRQQNSTRIWSSSEMNNHSHQFINRRKFNHNSTATQTNSSGYILHFQNGCDGDDARERSTGSCSGETIMKMATRRGGFDLARPAAAAAASLKDNNYISTAVSATDEAAGPSNKMSIDHGFDDHNEDSTEVELTLSIGVRSSSSSSSSKNKKKSKGYQLGCLDSFKADRGEDSSSPNTPMSSSSATFDQGKKIPHWLFGLSINRS